MSERPDPIGWFARRAYPRLAALVVLGAAVALAGGLLALVGGGTLGLRLAALGTLVFAFGGSGYVAFSVFDRGFE